jgi:hypothetical protein
VVSFEPDDDLPSDETGGLLQQLGTLLAVLEEELDKAIHQPQYFGGCWSLYSAGYFVILLLKLALGIFGILLPKLVITTFGMLLP